MVTTGTFGDRRDPAVLLIAGAGASMMAWDAPFCTALADRGRFVIRYDHRDTGRSPHDPPGAPRYDLDDLTADAASVLDELGLARVHVVGASLGGVLAHRLARHHPDRVASLTLMSTPLSSRPGPSLAVRLQLDEVEPPDWRHRQSIVDYLVATAVIRCGPVGPRDRAALHRIARNTVQHGLTASAANHALFDHTLTDHGRVGAPALVIHGARDPLVPLDHAVALVRELPDARPLVLPEAGHDLDGADWATVVTAILSHTTPRR